MTPELTSMTYRGSNFFITSHEFGQSLKSRMTETTMPEGRHSGGEVCGRKGRRARWAKRVQRPGAIAPGDHSLGLQILHRTTSGVKFNRTVIVGSELAHRNKILDKTRRNKDVIKT